MNKIEFKKGNKFLIKDILLPEADRLRLYSFGIVKGIIIRFYNRSIFGYPIAFSVDNRFIILDKKTIKNIVLEKIIENEKNKR
ncbi:MAG: FeoA family protein [Mycoplasmoidaceae bacterium]